jgi:hypothetical protein
MIPQKQGVTENSQPLKDNPFFTGIERNSTTGIERNSTVADLIKKCRIEK